MKRPRQWAGWVAALFAPFTISTLEADPIRGLFPTGVSSTGTLLSAGMQDPHYQLVQSADASFPGPNTYVVQEGFPIPPWLANGPDSKWIAPRGDQSGGNMEGDYVYRLEFDLTGQDPLTAVITGRWSTDNGGVSIRLNGANTGIVGDGNFSNWSPGFTIRTGFVEGVNRLEFVVNNAPSGVNPTGLRVELSGTADPDLPPGVAPTIVTAPEPSTVPWQESATFRVAARGSKPLAYQWRREGLPVAGANAATFTLPAVTATEAGIYDVIVSNDAGSVTSAPVRLSVSFTPPGALSPEPSGPSSRRTPLTISEIMYHPAPRDDGLLVEYLEIYNSNPYAEDLSGYRLTGDVNFVFPPGTTLAGLGRLVVAPAPADVEKTYGITGVVGGFTNRFSNGSGKLKLHKKSGALVLEAAFSDEPPWPAAADGAGHSLVLVRPSYGASDPRAWAASAFRGGSPGLAEPSTSTPEDGIQISEILSHTDEPQLDFIELQNFSPFSVNISGCFITDNPATNRFRIPDGTQLPPFGFVSFDQVQLGFRWSAAGETAYLLNASRTKIIDAVRFGGQENGRSWGRYPLGSASWRELSEPTPGRTNAPPTRPPIVISEIMFHPLGGSAQDEYLELFNRSGSAVDLSGWQFTEGVHFTFPSNTVLAAGAYLAIAHNAAQLLATHPSLPANRVLGDLSGQLDHGGEQITLARPDTLLATNLLTGDIVTNLFFIPVQQIRYGDGGRWGDWADGGGSSLELVDTRTDGTTAPQWACSDETAKAPWTTVEMTGALDLGVEAVPQADALQVLLLGQGEALLDSVEVLVNGINLLVNGKFDASASGWSFGGTHRLSRWEAGVGFGGGGALHLIASARGDHLLNQARCHLNSPINPGTTVTLRAKVRWLKGHPEILLRLRGNYLEASARLSLPTAFGTPGAANSRRLGNAGPSITEVTHRPVLPQAGQPIHVMARIADPDAIASVGLQFRQDPSSALTGVAMTDDGAGSDQVAGDGIFTGSIPAQAAGTLVAFRIVATDASIQAATSVFPADAPRRECLVRVGERLPADAFGTYRFWLTQANIDFWAAHEKMSNEDLDTTLVLGAHRIIYNAGAHYAGSDYTSPGYTSPVGALCGYDVRVPEDDLFLGERHITLDWPVRDSTDQREQLMFWFLDQLGLPNLYRRYVHLFVNGVERGTIYDDVQQPGDDVVQEWFPNDDQGSLWKTDCLYEFDDSANRIGECILNSLEEFTTAGGVKKTARYRWNWRPRAVGATANDFTDLFNLVDTMNAPASNYVAAVEALVDVDHWMRTFAMNDLASYWDGFGNPNAKNTFLYKPQHDRWKLFCWDFDVGLGAFVDPPDQPLFPTLNDPAMNRFYATPAFLRRYWRALDESLQSFFKPEAVTPLLTSKYEAFKAAGLALESPFVPSGNFGLSIPDWIAQRRTYLQSQLATVATSFSVAAPPTTTTTRSSITLTGTAPMAIEDLAVNGTVLPVTWTTVKGWTLVVPLQLGTNILKITGLDRNGSALANASATRTVISTATPPAPGGVIFNEWMADNAGVLADPADGKFDDWFELYNPTDQPADLSGYWLSDDALQPNRFVIPAGVQLPSHGYLLVWADNEIAQTSPDLHVNFKLDKSGETLTLRDSVGRLVDQVTFGAQKENVSEGHWPDGASTPAVPLPTASPRLANPRPPAPAIHILDLVWGQPNRVLLTWTSAPGYTYQVQVCAEIGNSNWTTVPGEVVSIGTTSQLTISLTAGPAQQFFRVIALP